VESETRSATVIDTANIEETNTDGVWSDGGWWNWGNADDLQFNDGDEASTVVDDYGPNAWYHADSLEGVDFGFTEVAGTILGIKVRIERYAQNTDDASEGVRDRDVGLIGVSGGAVGTSKADPDEWPEDDAAYVEYGGDSDLWDWGGASPAAIQHVNFGVYLVAELKDHPLSPVPTQAYVDHVEVTVYYEPPAPTSLSHHGLLGGLIVHG
jgi:hypothetical protein